MADSQIKSSDNVYEYVGDGVLQGSWTARKNSSNGKNGFLGTAGGIATNDTDIWIVDRTSSVVYRYHN